MIASDRPAPLLWAIGTSDYVDATYHEDEQRRGEPDSLYRPVPRSLDTVITALTATRVELERRQDNPSTTDLRALLHEASQAAADQVVIIYYTGHGEAFGADGYSLITTDFTKPLRWTTGIRGTDLPHLLVKRRPNGDIDPHRWRAGMPTPCRGSHAADLCSRRQHRAG